MQRQKEFRRCLQLPGFSAVKLAAPGLRQFINIQLTSSCFLPPVFCHGCRCSVTQSRLTPCDPTDCSTPGFPVLHHLLEFAQTQSIESVVPSSHLILCGPLLLLPSIFPSTRVFSNESALHIRWLKDWSFSFSISLSNVFSGLILFMIDWFDLLVAQGTLKSFLQNHRNLKASILWCSAFFMVQLSHQHMTTGKTIALTRETFVSKVMSLLFNMLSRMVIAFFLKEQASFNFMTKVTICSDFGAQEDKVCHCFHFFPIYLL